MSEKEIINSILGLFIVLEDEYGFLSQSNDKGWEEFIEKAQAKYDFYNSKHEKVGEFYRKILLAVTEFKEFNSKRAKQMKGSAK